MKKSLFVAFFGICLSSQAGLSPGPLSPSASQNTTNFNSSSITNTAFSLLMFNNIQQSEQNLQAGLAALGVGKKLWFRSFVCEIDPTNVVAPGISTTFTNLAYGGPTNMPMVYSNVCFGSNGIVTSGQAGSFIGASFGSYTGAVTVLEFCTPIPASNQSGFPVPLSIGNTTGYAGNGVASGGLLMQYGSGNFQFNLASNTTYITADFANGQNAPFNVPGGVTPINPMLIGVGSDKTNVVTGFISGGKASGSLSDTFGLVFSTNVSVVTAGAQTAYQQLTIGAGLGNGGAVINNNLKMIHQGVMVFTNLLSPAEVQAVYNVVFSSGIWRLRVLLGTGNSLGGPASTGIFNKFMTNFFQGYFIATFPATAGQSWVTNNYKNFPSDYGTNLPSALNPQYYYPLALVNNVNNDLTPAGSLQMVESDVTNFVNYCHSNFTEVLLCTCIPSTGYDNPADGSYSLTFHDNVVGWNTWVKKNYLNCLVVDGDSYMQTNTFAPATGPAFTNVYTNTLMYIEVPGVHMTDLGNSLNASNVWYPTMSNWVFGVNAIVPVYRGNGSLNANDNNAGNLTLGQLPTNVLPVSLANLVAAATPTPPTNFISGTLYTNSSGVTKIVSASIQLVPAAVAGQAGMQLRVAGLLTNAVGFQTLVTTLAMSTTNQLSAPVPAGSTYIFTNVSGGAGDSSAIVPGSGWLYP